MMSLRAQIAALLVGSITLVVVVSSCVVLFTTQNNADDDYLADLARQLDIVSHLAQVNASPDRIASIVQSAPPGGTLLAGPTGRLRNYLRKIGNPGEVAIKAATAQNLRIASLEIGTNQWLVMPIRGEVPPHDLRLIAGGWLLILIGTTAIALFVSRRITRPLALLEAFASAVKPNGEIGLIPETGPAEVRATARTLNRLNSNLQDTIASRMRLVAAAGHDMRTPLTRMRLRAEFLDEAERASWLANINELEHIADSAIMLVREQSGALQFEAIRLDLMIDQIVRELGSTGLAVTIVSLEPATVCGSPLALTRAFRNLIINAATHGWAARVAVVNRDESATVIIDDSGPGIPSHLIERAFEPFFRIEESRKRDLPGAGLGLAIAKEVIARVDGSLSLRNLEGGGLRQEVILNACRPGQHRALSETCAEQCRLASASAF
ncbi:ATP-binding protein [Bosea sp. LjRoot9]|uniref:ATP-binding protein n=1 Tax=Bosea sp. LjRoot9 TaxID=3342341 RepID=UPI003ECCC3FE